MFVSEHQSGQLQTCRVVGMGTSILRVYSSSSTPLVRNVNRPLNDRNTWISVLAKSVDRRDYESADRPIVVMAKDYPAGHVVPRHTHACGQLIYAVSGIMEVRTDSGLWLVPPQRALWMPAGIAHAMRTRSSPVALNRPGFLGGSNL
ncbi:AraC family ligand binding domain-containing protein [Azotobacter chroococcum]|uniref:AraC family ligand binding domain-containing protein n=2 Tax=Azotobacter chroococcum TaxID=353 RepID=UPI001FB1F51C|nr:AraC family ligand binding domain-containing protein [Azotobacter chroococcum]